MFQKIFFSLLFIGVQQLNAQKPEKTTYPLIVSFQSECCGVPSDSAVKKFISSFKKQYKIKTIAASRIGPMGREGEYYLAFSLTELSRKQKNNFISGIKKIRKLPTDKGLWSFKEKEEIDPAVLPGRASVRKIEF